MEDKEKEQVTNDIGSLTIHGLPKIVSSKTNISRIIWLVICVSALVFLVITATRSLIKYYRYEVFIAVGTKPTNHMHLPAVTFCHTNFYNPMLYGEEAPMFQHFPKNCSFMDDKYFVNDMNKHMFYFACRLFIGIFDAKTSGVGQELPEYFRFPEKFSFLPNIYPCVTLNRNSTLEQKASGEKYGLQMILYNEEMADETFTYAKKAEPLTERRQGVIVHIHDPKQHVPISDGIPIPEGFHTHVAIRRRIIKLKPSPYPSKCVRGDEQDKESIYPGKNTQMQCYSSCFFTNCYKQCPGVLLEMRGFMGPPKYPKVANYSDPQFWKCFIKSIAKYDYRKCNCSPICEEETYEVKVNRNPWPQSWQASSVSHIVSAMKGVKSVSPDEVRERLMRLSVYYDEMTETTFEEKEMYDLSAFTSDLGGQMGLFLGASLLSLIEIFALLFSFLGNKFFGSNRVKAFSVK
ncbi:acid-sensing ion channel 4-A-like [Rhopilema esculentum]|uniref:acid-sensing ion channel 4-A-like n=1 Tax=Rhopilema esculentum TaxID=499914 RepID=UPI0031E1C822|eukprot:gene2059-17626_t